MGAGDGETTEGRLFRLPDLGEGLTEGEIVRWLVDVGERIEIDQPVAEVETAKAVVEVPSPFAGTVQRLHAEVGQEVAVGEALLTVAPAAGSAAGAGTVADDAEVGEMVPEAAGAGDGNGSGTLLIGYGTREPRRRRRGAAHGGAAAAATAPASHEPRDGVPTDTGGRPLAKPPVRKLAKTLGVDLAAVPPGGPGGIITREDVEAFASGGVASPEALTAPGAAAPSGEPTERRPLKGLRRAIAAQMTRSRTEIPAAATWIDTDATELMAWRDQLNADGHAADRPRITPLALVLRICVAGLRRFPEVNSRLDAERDEIVLQRFVNLGVATQTDAGLMVPVVHGADRMTVGDLAGEVARLTARARERTLSPDELTGSTFTVSNYGSFGLDGGDPIINHPEAAILGLGRIADRPWVVDGEIVPRKVVTLTLAFDHRICDGAEAGGFLRFVADCVESPARLLAEL